MFAIHRIRINNPVESGDYLMGTVDSRPEAEGLVVAWNIQDPNNVYMYYDCNDPPVYLPAPGSMAEERRARGENVFCDF